MVNLPDAPTFWHSFIFYGKIAGAVVSFLSISGLVIGFLHKYLVGPAVKKIVHINETITRMDTNCIPTLQRTLDGQNTVLDSLQKGHNEIKFQFGQFHARQDGVERAVAQVHKDLMIHLENTSKEKRKKVKV